MGNCSKSWSLHDKNTCMPTHACQISYDGTRTATNCPKSLRFKHRSRVMLHARTTCKATGTDNQQVPCHELFNATKGIHTCMPHVSQRYDTHSNAEGDAQLHCSYTLGTVTAAAEMNLWPLILSAEHQTFLTKHQITVQSVEPCQRSCPGGLDWYRTALNLLGMQTCDNTSKPRS